SWSSQTLSCCARSRERASRSSSGSSSCSGTVVLPFGEVDDVVGEVVGPLGPFGCPHDDPCELAADQGHLVLRARGPPGQLVKREIAAPHCRDAFGRAHCP